MFFIVKVKYLFRIVLIKNLACKVTAVLSYHESVQTLAHLAHIYPDLPIQKYVDAAFEQIYHVCPTFTIIASETVFKSLTNMETIMRKELKDKQTVSPAAESGYGVSETSSSSFPPVAKPPKTRPSKKSTGSTSEPSSTTTGPANSSTVKVLDSRAYSKRKPVATRKRYPPPPNTSGFC